MTRYVVAPNGVPSPLLTHMMNKRTEEERKAPCARQCEAQAFKIELRQKDSRIAELEEQNKALLDALKEFVDAVEGVVVQGGVVTIDKYNSDWFGRARAAIAAVEVKHD